MRNLVSLLVFASGPAWAVDLVSVDSSGNQGAGESRFVHLSPSGRYVSFTSDSRFVAEDTDSISDAYLHDRETGMTTLISAGFQGDSANLVSSGGAIAEVPGGPIVSFLSAATNIFPAQSYTGLQVYVLGPAQPDPVLVSLSDGGVAANAGCSTPDLSNDGNLVVFASSADNLVGGDNNMATDVFVRDIGAEETRRINLNSEGDELDDGSQDAFISGNGRYVVFSTRATNLDESDKNGEFDVYRIDLTNKEILRVSTSYDREDPNGDCFCEGISDDGRFIIFSSGATNILPPGADTNGERDLFLFDADERVTRRVNTDASGDEAMGGTVGIYNAAISGDGNFVAFTSNSVGLVPNDSNGKSDAFRKNLNTGAVQRVSESSSGEEADDSSFTSISLSRSGSVVAFDSQATNLVGNDTNGKEDVFTWPKRTDPSLAKKAQLKRKLKRLKRQLRSARRKDQGAKTKRLRKKIRKLRKQIRRL